MDTPSVECLGSVSAAKEEMGKKFSLPLDGAEECHLDMTSKVINTAFNEFFDSTW